jgi:AAA family ATP:ADP antiporter
MPMSTQDPDTPRATARRQLVRALQAIVEVRDEEVGALFWSCLYFFSLLAGNYVLRPLRDEMGIAGGTKYLPWMFAGTLAAMLAVNPLWSAFAGRRPSREFLPALYRFLQANLLLFFAWPWLLPAIGPATFARAFFLWASVVNLFVISLAWGSLADRFRADQARRLFGFIGAGGTLGAIAGSSLTTALVGHVGPRNLLLLAVAFLELGRFAACRLLRPDEDGRDGEIVEESSSADAGGPLAGLRRAFGSPYLAGLGLSMLLFTASSAFVYLEQARIVDATFAGPAERTAFFARIDLLVNLVGLVLQTLLTGRIIAALGIGRTAALLQAETLVGFLGLAWRPTLGILLWFQVARRAIDYAVARPSREVLYTVVRRADKYQAKSFIDTAVYRSGDALGAWAFGLLAALPGGSRTATLLVVPLSLGWIALCVALGREQQRLAAGSAEAETG